MTKSKTIQVRVSPEAKAASEEVLTKMGLSMSEAVNMFLHQIVLRQAIPFAIEANPPRESGMSDRANGPSSNNSISSIQHLNRMLELASLVELTCRQYGIERLTLFGSQARGTASPLSDYDFRIDRGDLRGMDFFSFKHDLEQTLGAKVDLVTTESVDTAFLESIRKDEVILYDRNRAQ